jgi:hypothetical protein
VQALEELLVRVAVAQPRLDALKELQLASQVRSLVLRVVLSLDAQVVQLALDRGALRFGSG